MLTHTRLSDGAPHTDGALKNAARSKGLDYGRLYADRPDPIVFMPMSVSTWGRLYHDFIRLLFLHAHREAATLAREIPEESDQFSFLRAACLANLKGSLCLILAKA